MIVVFLIMIAMVGASTTVLIATRTNVRGAGLQREKMVSRYVAEAAVAQAKSAMLNKWSSNWSTLLTSPPPEANTYRDYTYGGTGGLPLVKARLFFSYTNNNDDPSLDPLVDQDGKVVITARGEILDPATSTPIAMATTIIEVQVLRQAGTSESWGYSSQSHGNAYQSSYSGTDANHVDFTNSFSF